ncbi:hypothetical protein DASC09_007400 [Saccharomycopsis crataegensis]|uniref:Uncharacterized protein n=1 Tax=Saccharomycopsis crataegensis TaxID=43959 RepID=A0AAV5QEM9_9ASCO|nr:hypothetical protein DASC09_007400 [Saccharomycopsis crataegensis]
MKFSTASTSLLTVATVAQATNLTASVDYVTDFQTTHVTITSCKDNACSETVKPTGYYLKTITTTGVVTHTTVYCPLTAAEAKESSSLKAAAKTSIYKNGTTNATTSYHHETTSTATKKEGLISLDAYGSTAFRLHHATTNKVSTSLSTKAHEETNASSTASVSSYGSGARNFKAAYGAVVGLGALLLL